MLGAQKRKKAKVISVTKASNALMLQTELGIIKVEPYASNIIHICYAASDDYLNKESLGIIAVPDTCEWGYQENSTSIVVLTLEIKLVIEKATCAFTYYDKSGRILVKEPRGGGKHLEMYDSFKTVIDQNSVVEKIQTADGVKDVIKEDRKVFNKNLFHTKLEFEWAENEALYGMGQQEEGYINLRGTRQYIHQANMKIAVPFLLSTKGYGILMDTYSPIIFNDNAYGSYIYNEAATSIDYYLIAGENFDKIIQGYRRLTGKAVMLPKWTFGYIQSLERYETQEAVIDTVKEYRKRSIPLDCIVLDWCYWEDGMWGQKSFDKERFPDPKGMLDELHDIKAHLMISVWPNMSSGCENYQEFSEHGGLFPKSEIYNAFDENSRKLYWKQISEGLFRYGVDAWWCDSSEPYTPEWNYKTRQEPDKEYNMFQSTASKYMDEEYTNAYPLMHAKAVYEGQRRETIQKRVVNLTRSGYLGQQRYGTILWSGDISAKWETLKKQIAAGLNLCASGLPYWTLDIGAFFVKQGDSWFWNGDYELGNKDLGYRELYTRWLQFGCFLPIFRSHGTDTRREAWFFGEEGEMFYDAITSFIKLRYKLMPYIYSMAAMVTHSDYTIMRLLTFDFGFDEKVYNITDQYMFGASLMVCPVTKPMYYDVNSLKLEGIEKSRSLYLPAETIWYDFWTNESFEGGKTIVAAAPIDKLPLYVKAGAIIPMSELSVIDEEREDEIHLMIYPGADGKFTLYQDETDNYNYENGKFALIEMRWCEKEASFVIENRQGEFDGMEKLIRFTIEIVGIKIITVVYEGKRIAIDCIKE